MTKKNFIPSREILEAAWHIISNAESGADLRSQYPGIDPQSPEGRKVWRLVDLALNQNDKIAELSKSLSPDWLLARLTSSERALLQLAFVCIINEGIYPQTTIRLLLTLASQQARKIAIQTLYSLSFLKDPKIGDVKRVYCANLRDLAGEETARPEGFSWRLVSGVWRNDKSLSTLIGSLSVNWRLERVGILERLILQTAFYEISCMPGAPQAKAEDYLDLAADFCDGSSLTFLRKRLKMFLETRKKQIVELACE